MQGGGQGGTGDLLRQVSRSFYLTLRVLPTAVRTPIGLGYLLARTTDTVADTAVLPVAARLEALQALGERILGKRLEPLDFGAFLTGQASTAEALLIRRVEEAIAGMRQLSPDDLRSVREVLTTIISGQELDLRRFGGAGAGQLRALVNEEELNDYTYRVAGCVGEFWTRICRSHLFPGAVLNEREFYEDAVRFGKGLQLVNILRDLPQDLRLGRCYLPLEGLAAAGLEPADLLEPANEPRLRPLYDGYLDRAQTYLASGWRYTLTIPRRCVRLRLACAWPVLIGERTLRLLRGGAVLSPGGALKISRWEVRSILLRTLILLPWERRWRRLFPGA